MSELRQNSFHLPPEQQAIRNKCFHPSGTFVEFLMEDVETSIPARFEKVARMYPDQLAIKLGDRALTYNELNNAANRIAQELLDKRGLGSEPIPLLLEIGIDVVAAILGVLKAGKCFVLLDPNFPLDRIMAIFEGLQAGLVITNRQMRSLAVEVGDRAVQLLECESIDGSDISDDPGLRIPPDALAFITYTSGSTGQPKGVMQNHRNTIHDALVRAKGYRISPDDRLSLLSFGTTLSITNIVYTLLSGSTLLPFNVRKNGTNRLAAWISTERISICRITAPLFRTFCDTITGREQFPGLRLLVVASDAIRPSDVELFRKHFAPGCLLATGLSSSETGVLTDYFIDCEIDFANEEIPVGYPVWDREVSLLDDDGKEISHNAVGEIGVRSRYLSPGYWRQPELTEAKFKSEPQDPTKRLYLTGDLGLMRPDGCLIHKGRKDFRIKIHGYGVELGEVERTLLSHPEVKEAGVAAWDSDFGEKRLVAYVVKRQGVALGVGKLNEFLRNKLPQYMIPLTYIFLDALPLTNGKLDRRALPKPDHRRPEISEPYLAPRNNGEEKLAQIWSEVLGLDRVGIHDSFFDLGGHSLAASRVISRVIERFQLDLPIKALLDAPTVAEMAAVLMEHQGKQLGQEKLERLLGEVESLSDEEARRLIAEESGRPSRGGRRN